MHWSTCTVTLSLACLLACGDTGKTSDAGTGDSASSSGGASSGASSTSATSAGTTTTDGGGSGSGGQTTSGSTSAGTSGASSTSVGTSNSSGPDTSGSGTTGGSTSGPGSTSDGTGQGTSDSTGQGTTGGGMCQSQGQSCAMGETCCGGLECCQGIPVPPGKEFCAQICPISDRNLKADFRPIDVHDVLARVAALDITTWRYKKDTPDVRHLGPMAQDFKAAFGLGDTDRMIFPLDATGVSMAAIQALHQRLGAAEAQNDDLRDRLGRLERRLAELEAR